MLLAVFLFSHVQCFATNWIAACRTPLSMWSPRQRYWTGLPFPPQGSSWSWSDLDQILIRCSWSSWIRDWTCVSWIGRQILYYWASREALKGIIFKIAGLTPLESSNWSEPGPCGGQLYHYFVKGSKYRCTGNTHMPQKCKANPTKI